MYNKKLWNQIQQKLSFSLRVSQMYLYSLTLLSQYSVISTALFSLFCNPTTSSKSTFDTIMIEILGIIWFTEFNHRS